MLTTYLIHDLIKLTILKTIVNIVNKHDFMIRDINFLAPVSVNNGEIYKFSCFEAILTVIVLHDRSFRPQSLST